MTDPVVVTDANGRASLPHGLDGPPTWVLVRIGDGASDAQIAVAQVAVDEFDAERVGFRVTRTDTGGPLAHNPLPIRMSAR